MKQYWEKLSPKAKQITWVGGIVLFGGTIMYTVIPESEHLVSKRTPQPVEHILTSKDARSLTLQSMAAKIDSLKTTNSKLTRQLDVATADIRELQKENAPTRIMQKEISELRATQNSTARQMASISDKVDNVQDSTLQITAELVDQVATEIRDQGIGGSVASSYSGQIPIAPSMQPVITNTGNGNSANVNGKNKTPASPIANPKAQPSAPINADAQKASVHIYDDAEVFFKTSSMPKQNNGSSSGNRESDSKPRKLAIRSISSDDPDATVSKDSKRVIAKRAEEEREIDDADDSSMLIPAGSFFEAVILAGMDAPTNQSARKAPFPALMRIKKEAILPSRYRADIKECFLIASGYGDMGSERAYLRGETLSCLTQDGGVIESRFDSYAVGEDAKAGVRGRLVTKNGALIGNALLAGFGEGLASALDVSVVPTISSSDNSTVEFQRVLSEEALQKGAVGGAKNAMSQIANYYLEMAENITPVIEIDAGRTVTFIATKGITLKVK